MGEYTEWYLSARLAPDVPDGVLAVLAFLFGDAEDEPPLPEHEFFTIPGWEHIVLGAATYYFNRPPGTLSYCERAKDGGSHFVNVSTDFKGYKEKLLPFLDWLCPHIETDGFLGFHRFETATAPTLLYRLGGRIVELETPTLASPEELPAFESRREWRVLTHTGRGWEPVEDGEFDDEQAALTLHAELGGWPRVRIVGRTIAAGPWRAGPGWWKAFVKALGG